MDELPIGRLILSLSRHYSTMIDGVINDTYDPRRGGIFGTKDGVDFKIKESRCVYGYWIKRLGL